MFVSNFLPVNSKVLMLGWEFPPFLNGGLGVATSGLAQALAPLTDLTLVLPRSHPQSKPPGVALKSLHGEPLAEVRETFTEQEQEILKKVRIEYVPVSLRGYEGMYQAYHPVERTHYLKIEKQREVERVVSPARTFEADTLYGGDLMQRVQDYRGLVCKMAESMDFDLIHAHDWMTWFAGLAVKAATGKPLVLHVHSLEYDRSGPDSRGWIFELERHALQQADLILPVSQYTADIVTRIYGAPAAKVVPTPNGITPFTAYKREKTFPEPLISFLGRVTYQKGPMYFFDAALQLLRRRRNLRFVIAGKGEAIPQLIQRAAIAQVSDRVHFTGFLMRDRTRELLAMTDVFVLPSVSEPFGLVALEAAQMEVPCIISNNSGVKEVLPGALQVDYSDTQEMAQQVLRLLDEPALRKEVVAQQLENLQHISWPRTAERIVAQYAQLLS